MAIVKGFAPAGAISVGVSRMEPGVAYSNEEVVEEGGYYFADPNMSKSRKGILTRYGKKILEEGAKFYARAIKDNSLKFECIAFNIHLADLITIGNVYEGKIYSGNENWAYITCNDDIPRLLDLKDFKSANDRVYEPEDGDIVG